MNYEAMAEKQRKRELNEFLSGIYGGEEENEEQEELDIFSPYLREEENAWV